MVMYPCVVNLCFMEAIQCFAVAISSQGLFHTGISDSTSTWLLANCSLIVFKILAVLPYSCTMISSNTPVNMAYDSSCHLVHCTMSLGMLGLLLRIDQLSFVLHKYSMAPPTMEESDVRTTSTLGSYQEREPFTITMPYLVTA